MSLSELKSVEAGPLRSWWLWFCWLEQTGSGSFVYGCSAPILRSDRWVDDREIDLPDIGRLFICQRIVSEIAFHVFKSVLDQGVIDASSILGRTAPHAKIVATRDVIQDALGHSAVRARLFYTQPDAQTLLGNSDRAFEALFSVLQDELNLPFKAKYAARLGNFEIFEINSWLDGPRPFLIEIDRDSAQSLSGPQTMEICRTPDFAEAEHQAHLVGRVFGDTVIDRLIVLSAGEQRVRVPVLDMLDQFDFRFFDASGQTLLHVENSNFLNRIGLVLSPLGRQMTIQDGLSSRAMNKGRALAAQASTVTSHSAQRSMVGGPAKGSWREFAEKMENIADAHLPRPSEDKWFARGVEGEVGAIAHLNRLLNGGEISDAVLVDPWFGVDALGNFALRLSSHNVHLKIITSWVSTDPDTGVAFGPSGNPTERLESALENIRPFLNPRLSVINLTDGKQQAFHDRYLLLYPHEGQAKVFLLSNSINKIAGNWPFSMSLFSSDVSREIQRYIEGLCDGRDTAKNKPLMKNFTWSSHAR